MHIAPSHWPGVHFPSPRADEAHYQSCGGEPAFSPYTCRRRPGVLSHTTPLRKVFETVTAVLIAYGAIGLLLLLLSGGKVNILPGPLVDRPTEVVPRGYSND